MGKELSFIVRLFCAWYRDHFRAVELTVSPGREVALVYFEELTHCYPLAAYTVGSKRMVTLNRHIVIKSLIWISYCALYKYWVAWTFLLFWQLFKCVHAKHLCMKLWSVDLNLNLNFNSNYQLTLISASNCAVYEFEGIGPGKFLKSLNLMFSTTSRPNQKHILA